MTSGRLARFSRARSTSNRAEMLAQWHPINLQRPKMRPSAQFAQQTAQTPPSWGVREIPNAEVRELGRMRSRMDLARISNGLLRLCDDSQRLSRSEACSPAPAVFLVPTPCHRGSGC